MGLFEGKKGLVVGIANDHSIAWAITQELFSEGAEIGFTHLPDKDPARPKNEKKVRKLVDPLGAKFVMPCDVTEGDRRFRHEKWTDDVFFSHLKQAYLLMTNAVIDTVNDLQHLDDEHKFKLDFYTRQLADAASPSNFILSNPDVLQATIDSNGQNLINGWNNLLEDWKRGDGKLQIKMTDYEAFELGHNLATTPGQVIYQNRMMQLIQYQPSTDTVLKRPLMIVPPWINKYYVMDLQEKNSMVKWLVDQGHTVFMISWVNPDETYRDVGFEEYMLEGPVQALKVIEDITGETGINAIGYCLGGTLLAATLAYFAGKNEKPIASATFLASMIDFSEPGELKVFIDEKQVSALEKDMAKKGYLDGSHMANSFGMLRANDLIWSFVINNYFMGRQPRPFDLLYWNADSTRMPYKMHSFYLRKMYMENVFKEAGGITLDGVPIDIRKIDIPVYFISAIDDHIAPWTSTYMGARLFNGPVRFVLGESGHIAGIINPPGKSKYGHFTRTGRLTKSAETWLEGADRNEGSWWPDWQGWTKNKNKEEVPARPVGNKDHPALEAAPGTYCKTRIVNID